MGSEVRMWKSNLSEANHTHIGIGVFQNALGEKNHPHSKTNQNDARGACRWFEEEEPKK
jgi:hypothetical protein